MSNPSFPLTPLSSPARPSGSAVRRDRGSTSSSGTRRTQQPQAFYKGDEYLMQHVPGWKPMSEAELHAQLKLFGVTDEKLPEAIAGLNHCVQEVIDGPGVRVMGWKPQPGEGNFYSTRIPNSDYTIRMWDGGMETYRQFCLDFYDTRSRCPVNLPQGFSLWPALNNPQGVFMMGGPLRSWENAYGYTGASIPPGEEKWSVPEGALITLRRDGSADFTFAVPVRNQVAVAHAEYGVL
ncbi:hypothetical protein K474DRAFT_1659441 [Panus rudis PR-1116 ss-1]|nr:hypothetical protein K474DRAFT_1659441 [Panus rudis PR-1116 ss-1]